MDSVFTWLSRDWPLITALAACFLAGAATERGWWRWQRSTWRGKAHAPRRFPRTTPGTTPPIAFDHAAQLRIVERAPFSARALLNKGELRLLGVLDAACAANNNEWRVMAQVSLGEILASPNEEAFRAVNTKRVDFLLVDRAGAPQHAVELQGTGHHLGPAATRDAIKREALRRAGIGYIEIMPGDTPADVRTKIARAAALKPIRDLLSTPPSPVTGPK